MNLPVEQRGFGSGRETIPFRELSVVDPDKGSISMYHTYPLEQETAGPTILMAPGWGEGHKTLIKFSRAVARAGRGIYTFNHHRHPNAHPDPEMYKSTTLETVFDEAFDQNFKEPITVVAHSEGAISAIKMASRFVQQGREQQIGAIELVAPAGITDITTPQRLLLRAYSEVARHNHDTRLMRALGAKSLLQAIKYTVPHLQLGLRELGAISKTDLSDEVREVAEAGIPIGVLGCQYDKIFPIGELRENCKNLPVDYEEIPSTHIQFFGQAAVQDRILEMADQLERKANDYIDNVTNMR